MSYDCSIVNKKGEVFENVNNLPLIGGTYIANGSPDLCFNITYNYASLIKQANPKHTNLEEWLNGRSIADTLPELIQALIYLQDLIVKTEPENEPIETDYWKDTPRNVYNALSVLVQMSVTSPDSLDMGIWRIE